MRKYLFSFIALASFSTLLLFSCKKDNIPATELAEGSQFFPLKVGNYIVYDVDSLYWDDFLKTEVHHHMQHRYETVDTFLDAAGRVSYVINVMTRKSESYPYVAAEVINVTPTKDRLEYSQKNLNIIKLVFPVTEGKTWNGLSLLPAHDRDLVDEFGSSKWKFTYANVGSEFKNGNLYFKNSVTVNHIDDQLNDPDIDSTAYAYKNYSSEIFAFDVGMVYRKRTYWVFQPKLAGGEGSGYRKGYQVEMNAVDYGKLD